MQVRTAEDVGALVREQRLASAMTQAQLAATTGTSRQWIVDLERGKATLALSLVLRALRAVGLTLRVEGATDRGTTSIDLDAVLSRARTPLSSTASPRTTGKRREKPSTKAPRASTVAGRKKRA